MYCAFKLIYIRGKREKYYKTFRILKQIYYIELYMMFSEDFGDYCHMSQVDVLGVLKMKVVCPDKTSRAPLPFL